MILELSVWKIGNDVDIVVSIVNHRKPLIIVTFSRLVLLAYNGLGVLYHQL